MKWKHLLMGCLALCILISYTVSAGPYLVLPESLLSFVGDKYGADAKARVVLWRDLMNRYSNEPELVKLSIINQFFNQVPSRTDLDNWGKEEYWATPVELLSINGGDCEDYAIAKFFSLRVMGIPAERLKITFVTSMGISKSQISISSHMVLAYIPVADADPLILDNLTTEIKPASQRRDLAPLYSFNDEGLWLSKQWGRKELIGRSEQIINWNGLLARIKLETDSAHL